MDFLVPADTRKLLENKAHLEDPNLFLLFRKFVGGWEVEKDKQGNQIPGTRTLGHRKRDALNSLATINYHSSEELLRRQVSRLQELIKSLKNNGFESGIIDTLQTQWRLAVGLGGKGALEIGLTLHPTHGFPYIPAPSLKGLTRAVAFLLNPRFDVDLRFLDTYVERNGAKDLLERSEADKLKKLLSYKAKVDDGSKQIIQPSDQDIQRIRNVKDDLEIIREVFGSQDQAGKVIFFDAFPTDFPKLEVDVVNVHYQAYYSKGETPGDWMSPVPSFFLAVAPNQKFTFHLASRDKKFLEIAAGWMKAGLTQLGIGGKTSSGYGFFNESKAVEIKDEADRDALARKLAQSDYKVSKSK